MIAGQLPDAGEFLLRRLSFLREESLRELAAEIAGVRLPDGSTPRRNLKDVGVIDWKSGPLTHVVRVTAEGRIIIKSFKKWRR